MKCFNLLLVIAIMLFPSTICAEFSDHEDFKPFKQHIIKILGEFETFKVEFEVSKPVELDNGQRIPLQLSFAFYKSANLPKIIEKLEEFKTPGLSLRVMSVALTASAEFRQADNETLLYATFSCGAVKGKSYASLPNAKLEMIKAIIDRHSFNFGIRRGEKVEGTNLWLTNLRQDSDNRLSLSAYCYNVSDLTELVEKLGETIKGAEIYIGSISSLNYSGIPVLRFELYGSAAGKSSSPMKHAKMIEELAKAATSTGGNLKDMRISPMVITEKILELPIEITVADLIGEEWEQVKTAISGVKIDKNLIEIVSDKGLQDEGHTISIKVKHEL